MDAERVRRALEVSKAIEPTKEADYYRRKVASRKNQDEEKTKRKYMQLPPVKLEIPRELKPKTVMKTVKTATKAKKPKQVRKPKERKDSLFDASVRFFTGFTSSQETRKKFGAQRIVQELQRNANDYELYGRFFEKEENWVVQPLQEMNLLKPGETMFVFEPQCILGIGGQGCVFLGKIGSTSYAFKIRSRTPSAIHSGTAASPGRRKSPSFRSGDRGKIEEEILDTGDGPENRKRVNFIDDTQQESLHREAVAAFRVYSSCNMVPKPLIYGYTGNHSFEVFVMESMDYTLHDFIRGTNWKTRMTVLDSTWSRIRESFEGCSRSGVVHFDIKPENIAFKLEPGILYSGLLDFGITKSQSYSLDKFLKGGKLYRPPGTVTFMGPRTHIWKPMSWADDLLASFFTMYLYGTSEGKSSLDKVFKTSIRKFKFPISVEDRKTLSPLEVVAYCLKYPPWSRFPYGSSHPVKKKQNENIVKEEVSLGMLKIHSITSPMDVGDIVSVILNLDGFLDDTIEMQGAEAEEFSQKAAEFLQEFLSKTTPRFVEWWIGFSEEIRKLIDHHHSQTTEAQRKKNMGVILELLRKNVSRPEEIEGLIEDSSYGRKLIEADMERPFQ